MRIVLINMAPTGLIQGYRRREGGENIASHLQMTKGRPCTREYDSQIQWRSHAMKFDPFPSRAPNSKYLSPTFLSES